MKYGGYSKTASDLKGVNEMKMDEFVWFARISLAMTAYYCFANLILVFPNSLLEIKFIDSFAGVQILIDMISWHLFAVLSLITFIIKIVVWANEKVLTKNDVLINLILHFIFTVVALGEIYYILGTGF